MHGPHRRRLGELQGAREVAVLLPELKSAVEVAPLVRENQRALSEYRTAVDSALAHQQELDAGELAAGRPVEVRFEPEDPGEHRLQLVLELEGTRVEGRGSFEVAALTDLGAPWIARRRSDSAPAGEPSR